MGSQAAGVLDWPSVWAGTAGRLREHCAKGRRHLLTEDTVRMSVVLELQTACVAPGRLALEVPSAELAGGKVDLTVDGVPGAVIELKYPRDSRTGISPDTMTMGELVRDFLRVAVLPAGDRWVVQVINGRLARYLANLSSRHDLTWALAVGETLTLGRETLEALPGTAHEAIGKAAWLLPVTALCVAVEEIEDGLVLYAYAVDPPQAGSQAAALTRRLATTPVQPAGPRGARAEIIDAVRRLSVLSGRPGVTLVQVTDDLRRRGSSYAESTIRTMMTSHMCVQAQGPGIGSYDDLERVGRWEYRLRPGR